MRLSYKHKFVYIAIGKSGSSSIRNALDKYSCIEYWGSDPEKSEYIHTNLRDVKKIFSFTDCEFDSYFKFSFVRNPWSRVVSYWNYINQCKISYLKNNHHPYFGPICIKILKECEQDFSLFIKLWNWHLPSFFDMLAEEDGTLLTNFVGKLENIQEDFNIVCDKIGIPRQKLPHKNKTKHKHYTEYYDEETGQIVAEKYAKDIEYFGYKLGK